MKNNMQISVIIPTFNEADSISLTIGAVKVLGDGIEIMVVDGESTDKTVSIAKESGATVISSERGRGNQLHAGASATASSALWFLHADSIPPPNALREIPKLFRTITLSAATLPSDLTVAAVRPPF